MGYHLHIAALLKNGYYKSLSELLRDDAANFVYLSALNAALN